MFVKTDLVKPVQTFVQAKLSPLEELVGSVRFLLAKVPQLTQLGNWGPGLFSRAGSSAGPSSWGSPLSHTLPQCRSCLLLPEVPAVTLLLPIPLLSSTPTRLYLPSAPPKPLLWLLLFIPCMLAKVSSPLFPSTCDSTALSRKTSCISPCLLYVSMYLSFDSPRGILQVFLCIWAESYWGPRGMAFIDCFVGSSQLKTDPSYTLEGYLSYSEITIICWLGKFLLLTTVSGSFCRQYKPKSIHRVA